MHNRIWVILILVIPLAACGRASSPEASAPGSEVSSGPAATTILTAPPLATANVIRRPMADRVIPLTPTPLSDRVVAMIAPTVPPADTRLPLASPVPVPATPPGGDPAMLEALLVASINQVRAANGLPAYQHSPELSAAARAHSCDLAAHGLISHSSSDGRTLTQRLEGASPPWEWPSESIAAGLADPAAIVALWMDEPPDGWHRRNILDVDQREVGAGYCYAADDSAGNYYYWTADFSRRGTT